MLLPIRKGTFAIFGALVRYFWEGPRRGVVRDIVNKLIQVTTDLGFHAGQQCRDELRQPTLHIASAEIIDESFPVAPLSRNLVEHGEEHDAFDVDIGPASPPNHVLEFGDVDPGSRSVEGVHDHSGSGQVQALSQGRRGDSDFEDIATQQAFDLLPVGRWQSPVMESHSEAQALEDCTVRAQPFLTKRYCSSEYSRVCFQQRPQRSALMKVDNHVRKRFDATSFRAEDEDGLPVVYQPPSCR